ncbi:Homeobox protein TGIF1 [Acrodontium crateriforme]|uniref:Homeobox protein TGIF1 n=1 Tax=Acrodontium crateriforme TaxID=150365 RepID=A0AAQ3MB55_9PEZI|nr:Homeobox protein TGIF1 [Acrodontium crateriforme]
MRDMRQTVNSILQPPSDQVSHPLPGDLDRATKLNDELSSPDPRHPNTQRITLPPLTSVLSGSLHTPPKTPHRHGAALPPSLEPSHTTSYHPLSLYPHKKQRTYSRNLLERCDQEDAAHGISVHRPADAKPVTAANERSSHTSPQQSLPIHRRQDSVVVPSSTRGQPTHYATSNDAPVETSSSSLPHRTPQPRSMSTTVESNFSLPLQMTRLNDAAVWHDRPPQSQASGSPGLRKHDLRPVRSYDTNLFSLSNSPCPHLIRHRTPTNDRYNRPEGLNYDRMERVPVHVDSNVAHIPYEYSPASMYTMSNDYDFQHSKARKRGNLPKQSTEIMKTWFDQNISNPYPSEEQKLHFSKATGVSMTQVSNWFINHRRRCPELRDKRSKSRHGSKDGEL